MVVPAVDDKVVNADLKLLLDVGKGVVCVGTVVVKFVSFRVLLFAGIIVTALLVLIGIVVVAVEVVFGIVVVALANTAVVNVFDVVVDEFVVAGSGVVDIVKVVAGASEVTFVVMVDVVVVTLSVVVVVEDGAFPVLGLVTVVVEVDTDGIVCVVDDFVALGVCVVVEVTVEVVADIAAVTGRELVVDDVDTGVVEVALVVVKGVVSITFDEEENVVFGLVELKCVTSSSSNSKVASLFLLLTKRFKAISEAPIRLTTTHLQEKTILTIFYN